jgi:hypothetical protein
MGERRQRAQARLATVDARGERENMMAITKMSDSNASATGQKPGEMSFGGNSALKGQYHFDPAKWFAQYPNQSEVDLLWKTVLAGPPVQVTQFKYDLAGLRAIALDPMYQLK